MVPDESRIKLAVGEHFRRTRETLGWTLSDVTERAAREGAEISISMLSRLERGQSALSIGDVAALCRSLGTSFAYLEDIITLRTAKSEIDITGQSFDELMKAGKSLASRGEYPIALGYFEAAADWVMLHGSTDPQQLADALIWSAEVHRRERRFRIATDLITRVLDLRCSQDQMVRALALNITILYMTENFGRAAIYAQQVAHLLSSVDPRVRAYAHSAIGMLQFKMERFADAEQPLTLARDLYADLGDDNNRARNEAVLGFCLARSGRTADGLALIRLAAANAVGGGFIEVASQAYRFLGEAHLIEENFDKARIAFEKAASLSRQIKRDNDLFRAWFWMWKLERVVGNDEARKRAQQVLSRMLPKVDTHLAEVQEFLAVAKGIRSAGRNKP